MPHSNRIKAQHTHPLAFSSWTAVFSTGGGGHVIKFWLIVHIIFVMASIQWCILGHLKIVFPPLCVFIILSGDPLFVCFATRVILYTQMNAVSQFRCCFYYVRVLAVPLSGCQRWSLNGCWKKLSNRSINHEWWCVAQVNVDHTCGCR